VILHHECSARVMRPILRWRGGRKMDFNGEPPLTLRQNLFRFAVVGTIAVLVQACLFVVLTNNAHFSGLLENTLGYGVSLVVSYVGQSRWTFSDRNERSKFRLLFIAAVSLIIGSGGARLIVDWAQASPLWELPIILIIIPVCSFLMMRAWAFRYPSSNALTTAQRTIIEAEVRSDVPTESHHAFPAGM
jgi:putative flippase GtrA